MIMSIKILGSADRNRTVDELIKDSARSGMKYLDLTTGNFFDIEPDAYPDPEPKPNKKIGRPKKR